MDDPALRRWFMFKGHRALVAETWRLQYIRQWSKWRGVQDATGRLDAGYAIMRQAASHSEQMILYEEIWQNYADANLLPRYWQAVCIPAHAVDIRPSTSVVERVVESVATVVARLKTRHCLADHTQSYDDSKCRLPLE